MSAPARVCVCRVVRALLEECALAPSSSRGRAFFQPDQHHIYLPIWRPRTALGVITMYCCWLCITRQTITQVSHRLNDTALGNRARCQIFFSGVFQPHARVLQKPPAKFVPVAAIDWVRKQAFLQMCAQERKKKLLRFEWAVAPANHLLSRIKCASAQFNKASTLLLHPPMSRPLLK